MHRRSPAKLPDVCRDPPAREVSLTAAYRPPWGRHHSAQFDSPAVHGQAAENRPLSAADSDRLGGVCRGFPGVVDAAFRVMRSDTELAVWMTTLDLQANWPSGSGG